MDWKTIGTWTLATALAVGLATEADAGRGARKVHRTARTASGIEAIAALSPVGAAFGWGRAKAQEKAVASGSRREVTVEIFSVEPMASFTIEIDGVALGTVRSDAAGWAALRLESPDDAKPPVPAALPGVGDLRSVDVLDASGAPVLSGEFAHMGGMPAAGSVYEEKISLTDPSGNAVGVAEVQREASGTQEFDTRASGLTPGAGYRVFVDGFAAGTVTADAVGQARLSLEAPDDENPLPAQLQPIEDLRLVEWLDAADTVVLTGSFTGVPNHDNADDEAGDGNGPGADEVESFAGRITGLVPNGFTLDNGMITLTVVVTPATVFDGFSSLADLAAGAMVEVEGALSGTTLTADRIELRGGDIEDDNGNQGGGEHQMDGSLEGSIAAMNAGGFDLATPDGTVPVVVTATTMFRHVSGLSDLRPGDLVEVKGGFSGPSFVAERIELVQVDRARLRPGALRARPAERPTAGRTPRRFCCPGAGCPYFRRSSRM